VGVRGALVAPSLRGSVAGNADLKVLEVHVDDIQVIIV